MTSSKSSLPDLPYDVLFHVLSYLDKRSVLAVGKVCWHLRAAVDCDDLWRVLCLRDKYNLNKYQTIPSVRYKDWQKHFSDGVVNEPIILLRFNVESLKWELNPEALAVLESIKQKSKQCAIVSAVEMDPANDHASDMLNTLLGINGAFPHEFDTQNATFNHEPCLVIWGRPYSLPLAAKQQQQQQQHHHHQSQHTKAKSCSSNSSGSRLSPRDGSFVELEPNANVSGTETTAVVFMRAYGIFPESNDYEREISLNLRKELLSFVHLFSSLMILCKHAINNDQWMKEIDHLLDVVSDPPVFGSHDHMRSLLVCTHTDWLPNTVTAIQPNGIAANSINSSRKTNYSSEQKRKCSGQKQKTHLVELTNHQVHAYDIFQEIQHTLNHCYPIARDSVTVTSPTSAPEDAPIDDVTADENSTDVLIGESDLPITEQSNSLAAVNQQNDSNSLISDSNAINSNDSAVIRQRTPLPIRSSNVNIRANSSNQSASPTATIGLLSEHFRSVGCSSNNSNNSSNSGSNSNSNSGSLSSSYTNAEIDSHFQSSNHFHWQTALTTYNNSNNGNNSGGSSSNPIGFSADVSASPPSLSCSPLASNFYSRFTANSNNNNGSYSPVSSSLKGRQQTRLGASLPPALPSNASSSSSTVSMNNTPSSTVHYNQQQQPHNYAHSQRPLNAQYQSAWEMGLVVPAPTPSSSNSSRSHSPTQSQQQQQQQQQQQLQSTVTSKDHSTLPPTPPVHQLQFNLKPTRYFEDYPLVSEIANWFGKTHGIQLQPISVSYIASIVNSDNSSTDTDQIEEETQSVDYEIAEQERELLERVVQQKRESLWAFVGDLLNPLSLGWPICQWAPMKPSGQVVGSYLQHCVSEANQRAGNRNHSSLLNTFEQLIHNFARQFLTREMELCTEFYRRATHAEIAEKEPLEMHELVRLSDIHTQTAIRMFTHTTASALFPHNHLIGEIETQLKNGINNNFRPIWRENSQFSESYCHKIFDSCFKWVKAEVDCPSQSPLDFCQSFESAFHQSLETYLTMARGSKKWAVLSFCSKQYTDLVVALYPQLSDVANHMLTIVEQTTMEGTLRMDRVRSTLQRESATQMKKLAIECLMHRLMEERISKINQIDKSELWFTMRADLLERMAVCDRWVDRWTEIRRLFISSVEVELKDQANALKDITELQHNTSAM